MMNKENWKEFKIGDIFKLVKGRCSSSPDLNPGYDLPYLGAKKKENGVIKWVALDEDSFDYVSKGNAIMFICQGAGSNGFNLYVDIDSIVTTSNTMGYNNNLNKYNALFIVTVLDLERPKWCFGRGRAPKLGETIIKLPSKDTDKGIEPDWKGMEKYMKNIFRNLEKTAKSEFI